MKGKPARRSSMELRGAVRSDLDSAEAHLRRQARLWAASANNADGDVHWNDFKLAARAYVHAWLAEKR